jgi:rubrerythrin
MTRADFVRGQLSSVTQDQAMQALTMRWALAAADDFSGDVDVLNFALTLEYLEAAWYAQALKANLVSGTELKYVTSIANDEQAHVDALTATIKQLGGTPVAAPAVTFGSRFADRQTFLTTSLTVENVGVGAYLGAAGYIKDKAVLQAAAGIFGVEARHAAVVANLLGQPAQGGVFHGAFETPLDKATVLSDVGPFLMTTPTGSVDTGGGSAAPADRTGLFAIGGAALLGAAGVATYAATRRPSAVKIPDGGTPEQH